MDKKKRKSVPEVLKAWWSKSYALFGEKIELKILTQNAIGQVLNLQIYEFRRKNKIIKEIDIPIHSPEVSAEWKVQYKSLSTEYGNPEFKFKARIGKISKVSNTLYIPDELQIALTFDDGPAPKENPRTEIIFNILKKHKIKATFFVEHSNIKDEYRQNLLKKMKKEGHIVGIHGVDSDKHHLPHQDTPEFENKLQAMRNLIKNITNSYPVFIRPPYGWGGWERGKYFNKIQLRKIYQKLNMTRINGWEAEVGKSGFWLVIDKKIENVSNGHLQKLIILSHDLRKYDVDNLPKILQEIQYKSNKVKVKIRYLTIDELIEK